MRDGQRTSDQYNAMAAAYAAENEEGPWNTYYERPATMSLVGDPNGRRVLDVGCGHGVLTSWLVDNGATVSAIDVSEELVGLARARIGERAQFLIGDITDGLPQFDDGSVDLVVASLVMHYIEDWTPVLREFRRVLAPGGSVVFSTHHPAGDWLVHSPDDYFATLQVTETWVKGGKPYPVTVWRRPLTSITGSIADAGFGIDRLIEPEPTPELRDLDPKVDASLRTTPRFLFFRLSAQSVQNGARMP